MHALTQRGVAAAPRARARGLPLRLCAAQAQKGGGRQPLKPKAPASSTELPFEVTKQLPWDAEFKSWFMENYWQARSRRRSTTRKSSSLYKSSKPAPRSAKPPGPA